MKAKPKISNARVTLAEIFARKLRLMPACSTDSSVQMEARSDILIGPNTNRSTIEFSKI